MTIKSFEVQGEIQTETVSSGEISNPTGVAITSDRGTLLLGNQPEIGGPSHYHVMKDNNSGVDLFFGDDHNYILQRGSYGPTAGYGVEIGTNDMDGGAQQSWRFGTDGVLTLPGIIVNSTVAKTGSGVPGTGQVATITLNPTNNTNFVPGTYYGIFLGIGSGFNFTLFVAPNGDLTTEVVSSNGGFVGGETGVLNGSVIAGGTTGIDNIDVTVATLTNVVTATVLDLTKQVQKLTDGYYTLANGAEGQIMYLVRQTGAIAVNITVTVANARVDGVIYTPLDQYPFDLGLSGVVDISTLIFTDGAWQAIGGSWD